MDEREYVNIKAAARILSVSVGTVYKFIRQGRLSQPERLHPLYAKHGPVRLPLSEVAALAGLTVEEAWARLG